MLKIAFTAQLPKLRSLASAATCTVDKQEIKHFEKFVAEWWDEFGPMKPLHSLNKLRIPLIRDGLVNTGAIDKEKLNNPLPLKDISLLDVGCGGGILAEPLARLGGKVTGIDANPNTIELAKSHSQLSFLDINCLTSSIEEHASNNPEKYDAVVASEILEHVSKKDRFLEACVKCLKPNGSIFVTTINKTFLANFLGIVISENVLQLLPRGTHQYEKFIEPVKLRRMLEDCNCRTQLIHGMFYNIFTNTWHWCTDTSINYALHVVKLKNV
ncbi:ubiquinone biosynthesis O-methyltransferase, mitochondrial [Anoplophora glabripennis]|uniref:ubiquinone biosynthesis O-methyltransferase, mitochondrial n=1 Tax=Anoplophora glabripennis TaxID=217634 RepID=UPI0008745D70|nr:ubiquinone biosynthesis O-methyltransferase, mitochondrial [Anoplophora glabripennis]